MRKILYASLLLASTLSISNRSYAADAPPLDWTLTSNDAAQTCVLQTNRNGLNFGFIGDANQNIMFMKSADWNFKKAIPFTASLSMKYSNNLVYNDQINVIIDPENQMIRSVDSVDVHDILLALTIDGKIVRQVRTQIEFTRNMPKWVIDTTDAAALVKDFDTCTINLKQKAASINGDNLEDSIEAEKAADQEEVNKYLAVPDTSHMAVTGFTPDAGMQAAANTHKK